MVIERFFASNDVGVNLEDQRAFYELDRLLEGKPEVVSGDKVISLAEPPSWAAAAEIAEKLLIESKDLRVAVGLLRCLLAMEGLQGFVDGFTLVSRLVSEYWDTLYPLPDSDEPDNFMDRSNALAVLNTYEGTIVYYRNIKLLKNTKSLVLTPRMFGIASGKLQAKNDEQEWTLQQLRQAVAESNTADIEAVQRAIVSVQSSIRQIKRVFQDRAFGDTPDFASLESELAVLLPFFVAVPAAVTESSQPVLEGAAPNLDHRPAGAPTLIQIQSREDVINMLERLCVFMEASEPAHPSPLFMRRAQRLLSMSFMEIVQDLTPDAVDTVSHYKGRDPDEQ